MTILLVEDDPDDVLFVRAALEHISDQVRLHVVEDGEAAEFYLGGRPPYDDRQAHPLPDLVLLDIKLPKRTGLEVLEWMKTVPALEHILVVMMSSSTERTDVERAYQFGANAYLSKEADAQTLEMVMRGLLAFVAAVRAERAAGAATPRLVLDAPTGSGGT